MTLLNHICHCVCVTVEADFEVSYAQATPSMTAHFLLPADQDVELLFRSPVSCLPACHQAAHNKDNGPNF